MGNHRWSMTRGGRIGQGRSSLARDPLGFGRQSPATLFGRCRLPGTKRRGGRVCLIQLSDGGHVLATLRARQAGAPPRTRVAGGEGRPIVTLSRTTRTGRPALAPASGRPGRGRPPTPSLWYHTRTTANLGPSYRFSGARRGPNAGSGPGGTVRTRRPLAAARPPFAGPGGRALRPRSTERPGAFPRGLQESVDGWPMAILSRRIRGSTEARTRPSRGVTGGWKPPLEGRMPQGAAPRTRAPDHCGGPAFGELRGGNWIARERRGGYGPADAPGWGARNLARPGRLTTWPLRGCPGGRRPSGAAGPGDGSYLVDSASSHMLVSKIKPCMSKYKQSIR
jgi:hypothetical protein